jgi:hypothetical protein
LAILCERPLSKHGNRLGGLTSERLAKSIFKAQTRLVAVVPSNLIERYVLLQRNSATPHVMDAAVHTSLSQ